MLLCLGAGRRVVFIHYVSAFRRLETVTDVKSKILLRQSMTICLKNTPVKSRLDPI